MHIASHGLVKRSVHAAFCGYDFAAYNVDKMGSIVIARRHDGKTLYLQGDDADALPDELNNACDVAPDDECAAIDRVLDAYNVIEDWDAFADTQCAPSSDLMLLNYY